jgi:hypothetical protein
VQYRSPEPLQQQQGLGFYPSCSMSESNLENGGSVPTDSTATNTNTWPTSGLQHRNAPRSIQSTPNILSADYDPFAPPFHPTMSQAYSHDIYATRAAEVTILPASPLPSNTSQRSSFSSPPASEIFQAGSIHPFPPRVKMEDNPGYSIGSEVIMMSSSPEMAQNLLPTSSYQATLDVQFFHDQSQMGWSKNEYATSQELPSLSSLPNLAMAAYDRRSISQERASIGSHAPRRTSSTIARTRQPRKLTTKEDANFQCQVKGCGKLFGRSYNFKAHMETHDASREYPFPCPLKDCTKKFVRKTDLQRHHQSVHMKQRNHKCDYCSRYFARKDTLRRHMEDGCSKRFDIETVDFRPHQPYSIPDQSGSMRLSARPTELLSRQPSYSSSTHYSLPPSRRDSQHENPLTSAQGAYLERHDYLGASNHQQGAAVWSQ